MSRNALIAILAVAIMLTAGIAGVVIANSGSSGDSHEEYMRSLDIHKLGDYTYSIYYQDYDYDKGRDWLSRGNNHFETAYCTGVYKNGILGRNYDWKYSDEPSLIVRTAAVTENGKTVRHATLGVIASHILSDAQIDAQKWDEKFEYLPFYTVDGMNDAGLVCQMNVVPTGDHGITDQKDDKKQNLYAMMSVRYILDFADSVDDAIKLLDNSNFKAADHEIHIMIAQGDRSVVVEYIDNVLTVVENQYIMTNFYLKDVENVDYGNGEQWSDEWYGQAGLWGQEWYSKLTPYAAGMNRYDIVRDAYDGIEDADDMHDVMFSILYQKSYDRSLKPFWYDEFIGHGEYEGQTYSFTKYVKADDKSFNKAIDMAVEQYEHRKELRANGETITVWQTIHSSVYDTKTYSMTVWTQTADNPDPQPHKFSMLSANDDMVHVSIVAVHGTVDAESIDVPKGTTVQTIEGNKLVFSDGTVVITQPESDGKYKLTKWTVGTDDELTEGYRIDKDTQFMAHWEDASPHKTANKVFLIAAIVATIAAVALIGAAIYGYSHPLIYILATVAVIAAVFLYLVFFKVIRI